MAEFTIAQFDFQKVKNGATIGYTKENKTFIAIQVGLYENVAIVFAGYALFSDQTKLYFYEDGGLYDSDGKSVAQAYIIESTITKTTGTKIARVTDENGTSNARPISRATVASEVSEQDETNTEEIFSIATLQPREEIAMHCMESMLTKFENPLNIDNTKIKQLVSKSFLFAQEFINQSVLYREKETTSSTVESSKYASVDSDSLSSDTDKLLYNIATALTNAMAQSKNQYADQQKNGLKVNTSDINVKTTFPDTINANISGSVNASVSGSITTKEQTTE